MSYWNWIFLERLESQWSVKCVCSCDFLRYIGKCVVVSSGAWFLGGYTNISVSFQFMRTYKRNPILIVTVIGFDILVYIHHLKVHFGDLGDSVTSETRSSKCTSSAVVADTLLKLPDQKYL